MTQLIGLINYRCMEQMKDFFSNVFEKNLWPARWHCGEWSDFHGWLYIVSDLLIWAAYFTIPVIIVRYVHKKQGVRFYTAYFYFAAFILACGFTHLLDALMFWVPVYRFNAIVRFITGIISWLTIYHLIKMIPIAFTLKTSEELEEEVKRREKLVIELEASNAILRKQNEFIEKIFDSTVDHMNVYDTELNLISVNNVTLNLLGKTRADMLNKNFSELFPDAFETKFYFNLVKATKGEFIKNDVAISPADLYFETSFTPLFENGKQYGVLVMSRDVTESIVKENALQQLNEQLNVQNKKLQDANVELEQFTHILSHDLQEPLRKIQSFSSLMETKKEKDNQLQYIPKIVASVARMKNLIKDVLDYSQMNDKNEAFKIIDLNVIIRNAVTDLELAIAQKQAVIEWEDLPMIKGVEYQIAQVFYNLLGNAIKYCDKVPLVKISHRILYNEDGKNLIEISIQDNGIGFEEQYKEYIFSPFKRLHTKNEYEGTGIGLALVKKVIESHHGIIYAKSETGKGSLFVMVLPLEI